MKEERKNRQQRLKDWVETLNVEQLKDIVIETVDYCIDSEMVSFYDTTIHPYWSHSGYRLDGIETDEE